MTTTDGHQTPPRKRGRPKTGRSTQVVAVRLTLADYEALDRKAQGGAHKSVSDYLHFLIRRELYHHQGEGTRKRLKRC